MRYECEFCHVWTPFIPSWYDPERQVAEAYTLKEWDEEIYALLADGWTVENEPFIYYWPRARLLRRRGLIQRYLIATIASRRGGQIVYDRRDKVWGSGLQRKLSEWFAS